MEGLFRVRLQQKIKFWQEKLKLANAIESANEEGGLEAIEQLLYDLQHEIENEYNEARRIRREQEEKSRKALEES